MSIFGAIYAAVSGLNANSNALGIISDNIANSNTIGYKDTSTDFSTLVTQSGVADDYSPGGVVSQPLYNVAQQGAIQGASSPTDLAISGGGFFVVNSSSAGAAGNGTTSFTRAGNFTVDANGNLVNAAGLYLQGQTLSAAQSAAIAAGAPPTLSGTTVGGLQTVNVNGISETASPTAAVTLAANLPANAVSPETMTVPVYDSEGVEHDLTLTFTPSGTVNKWNVSAAFANAGASTATIGAGDDVVQFNPDGTLDAAATTFNAASALSIGWDPTVSGGTTPQTLSFNLGANGGTNGLSQLGNAFTVSSITQDGVQFGNFSSVSFGNDGLVTAHFSNGLTRAIAIVPIATFEDPNGLDPTSGNTYLESANSGAPLLAQAGTGGAGQIEPSSLENSTVDIANEFSQLIIAQNAYSANSKVITTANQMTQSLLSIQTG
ncbi:MAG TPA: flagellar hook protein FlgE [Stellaceae bacterium]|nr:flagellar hook protein FlgE [Stellaceae bacterium]